MVAASTDLATMPAMPARALAPSRKRAYYARTGLSQDRAARVQAIVSELSVTPTIRQVFYILVGEHLIEKTEAGYKSLVRQLGAMRKGGILPYTAVIDGTRNRQLNQTFGAPSEMLRFYSRLYRRNPWATQPVVAEVWAEADTLSQMLWQAADPAAVPLVVCRGNSSLSQLFLSAFEIYRRWTANEQRTVILYVGDFDPAGMDMSDGLHQRLVDVGAPGEAFKVERVAVTPEQIATYRLPPHEPKHKDARTPQFVARYGVGCVEADALPPEVLVATVDHAIKACISDQDAWQESIDQEQRDMQALKDMLDVHCRFVDLNARAWRHKVDDAAELHSALITTINTFWVNRRWMTGRDIVAAVDRMVETAQKISQVVAEGATADPQNPPL